VEENVDEDILSGQYFYSDHTEEIKGLGIGLIAVIARSTLVFRRGTGQEVSEPWKIL
jgi:hypothetical protein